MSNAPRFDIDLQEFSADPYPTFARMRADAPIAYVPQLDSTLFTRRDDIFVYEKMIDVFSSHQPKGLMNRLMGHNMMRKDGDAHLSERNLLFPALSPRTVKEHWKGRFQAHADRVLEELSPIGRADLCRDFALRFSAECLKSITGLTNMRFEDMDAWSQAMIDGIANYAGKPEVEARCHAATAGIDAAIDDMLPVRADNPDRSLLGVMLEAGMPMESVRANVELSISGGQNGAPSCHRGCGLGLAHAPRSARARARRPRVLDPGVRGICEVAIADRNVAAADCQILVDRRGSSWNPRTASSSCSPRPIATRPTSRTPPSST